MRTQVLAYSGGLDTSTQLAYLAHEKGYEVCAYIADLGQDDVKDKAAIAKAGAMKVEPVDTEPLADLRGLAGQDSSGAEQRVGHHDGLPADVL